MKPPPKSRSPRSKRNTRKKVERADQTSQALDLAREGKSLREIARIMGCSHVQVWRLIEEGRKAIPRESIAAYTAKIIEQSERIIDVHSKTLHDPDSAKIVMIAHRNLMALQGLEAPKQVLQVTQDVSEKTPAEAQRVMRELFATGVGPAEASQAEAVSETPTTH